MQLSKQLTITIAIVFLCSCIAFAGGIGLGFGLRDAQETTAAEPTVVALEATSAYEPAEQPASRGELLWEDDFSRERWDVFEDSDHRKGYAAEQYFFEVKAENYNFWSITTERYEDFVLEVETYQLDGPDDNDYGVILRYQDDQNFYSFRISGDGYYVFDKLVEGDLLEIVRWQESSLINQGHSFNTIRVEAVGENFTFYINDELVDAAIDAEFSQGRIGLLAGSYEEPGVHVAFDNLKVWAVEK